MKQNMKTAVLAFIATLFLFGVSFSAFQIWAIFHATEQAETAYCEVQQEFVVQAESDIPTINWTALQKQYPDIVAWLFCPDTELDYPVVQGDDNSYYLTHLATGEANKHGAVFADYRSSALLADENTILYGHNMKDGTMFHSLLNWGNADYAATHSEIYLLTPNKNYVLWVFNACVVTADSPEYLLDFESISKADWLDQCARHSYFSADFVPSAEMPVVTFSTCSGKGRWFVVQTAATEGTLI